MISRDQVQKVLASALTFHASFDHGADADVARGDARIYSASTPDGQKAAFLTPGLGDPPLGMVKDQGKFGAALVFTQENSHVAVYKPRFRTSNGSMNGLGFARAMCRGRHETSGKTMETDHHG